MCRRFWICSCCLASCILETFDSLELLAEEHSSLRRQWSISYTSCLMALSVCVLKSCLDKKRGSPSPPKKNKALRYIFKAALIFVFYNLVLMSFISSVLTIAMYPISLITVQGHIKPWSEIPENLEFSPLFLNFFFIHMWCTILLWESCPRDDMVKT